MDSSVVFTRWRQCAPHLSLQHKQHLNAFSHFSITHGRVSLGMPGHVLSPKNCPFPWGIWTPIQHMVPWTHPSQNPKQHLDRVSRLCTSHGGQCLCFTMGRPSLQKLPIPTEDLDPTRVLNPNNILIGSAILTRVTDRPCCLVGTNRQHLCT